MEVHIDGRPHLTVGVRAPKKRSSGRGAADPERKEGVCMQGLTIRGRLWIGFGFLVAMIGAVAQRLYLWARRSPQRLLRNTVGRA